MVYENETRAKVAGLKKDYANNHSTDQICRNVERSMKQISECYIRQSSSSEPSSQSRSPSHFHACRAHSPFVQVNRLSGQGSTPGASVVSTTTHHHKYR